jgi:PAS domain S-box-containing protein
MLTLPPHSISVFWPPNGVVLGIMLLTPRWRWNAILAGILLGQLVLNFVDAKPPLLTAAFTVANIVEIWIGAVLMQRFCGPVVLLRRTKEVVYLILFAAVLGCAVSGAISIVAVMLVIPETTFLSAWAVWMVADGMSTIILTPVLLTWVPHEGARLEPFGARYWREAIILFVLLALVSEYVFGPTAAQGEAGIPMLFLVFPFVLWAAVRLGPRGASAASLIVTLVAVGNASVGSGPKFFRPEDAASTALWLQVYLAAMVLSVLFLAAVWSERSDFMMSLEESKDRLARTEAFALVMTTHVALDGRWLKVPPPLCKLLGRTEQDLLSKALKDVVHAGDIGAIERRCRELRQGKARSFDAEIRLIHEHGTHVWVEVSFSVVTGSNGELVHFLTHIRDISKRRRTEELLLKEREYTTHIVSTAPAMICGLAPDGAVVSVNPFVTKETGYVPEEIVGKSFWEILYPGELAAQVEKARAELQQDGGGSYEMELEAKDGSRRTVAWNSASQSDEEDRPVELILIGNDITARKQAEAALRGTLDELEARVHDRTKALVEANRSLEIQIAERVRVEEALRIAHEGLEVRVEERTLELVRANTALETEIEERRRAKEIILSQARELFELSTPIVKIGHDMELVPLIGKLDSQRAEQLMEQLLERVARDGSNVVLLDVTGVLAIEHETAQHLIKTIAAVRLLGAETVLTGVRPAIARTLVDLGIDLGGIETQGSLAAALGARLRRKKAPGAEDERGRMPPSDIAVRRGLDKVGADQ